MDRALIQQLVRRRIKDRRLPRGCAVFIREMMGDGRPCDACEEPISPGEKLVLAMVRCPHVSTLTATTCGKLSGLQWLVSTPTGRDGDGNNKLPLDDPVLREKARQAIRTGNLPSRSPDRLLGGPGGGAACAVCGEPVMYYTTELGIEFQREGATSAVDSYRLHHLCFAAWEMERARTEGTVS